MGEEKMGGPVEAPLSQATNDPNYNTNEQKRTRRRCFGRRSEENDVLPLKSAEN